MFASGLWCFPLMWLILSTGCGTTREKLATEQLLLSDAVDRAVAHIDFSPLSGEKVYLDTQYIKQAKSGAGAFANTDYIISSLRQQMMLAGCLLQETEESAIYVAEARVGALGTDGHDVNFGIPPSQTLNAAASVVSGGFALPALPEISLARHQDDTAAAKMAVFAYKRESKEPAWQSGLSIARSRAHGRWILGAGPFQSGTIYKGTQFAGERIAVTKDLDEGTAYAGYRDAAVLDRRLRDKLIPWRDGEQPTETIASRPTERTLPSSRPRRLRDPNLPRPSNPRRKPRRRRQTKWNNRSLERFPRPPTRRTSNRRA